MAGLVASAAVAAAAFQLPQVDVILVILLVCRLVVLSSQTSSLVQGIFILQFAVLLYLSYVVKDIHASVEGVLCMAEGIGLRCSHMERRLMQAECSPLRGPGAYQERH